VNLGLSKKEFLAMSPKEFYAMNKCHQERTEHMDWQVAGMKSFYANCNGVSITAEDFMGKKKKPVRKTAMSDERLEAQLTSLFGVGPEGITYGR
jgi:hypothetical protein